MEEIEELIKEYANIRQKFEKAKKDYSEYLSGNDNYIGIIGEYWAKIFLETLYKNIDITNTSRKSESEKWVDFELKHSDTTESISVKTIFEDKNKTSGPIKLKDKPGGVCSIVILKLNDNLFPSQILYIKDIDNYFKNNKDEVDCKKAMKFDNYKDRLDCKKNIKFKYYKDGFDPIFKDNIWKYEDNKFSKI
jgi:hypothetical protein